MSDLTKEEFRQLESQVGNALQQKVEKAEPTAMVVDATKEARIHTTKRWENINRTDEIDYDKRIDMSINKQDEQSTKDDDRYIELIIGRNRCR